MTDGWKWLYVPRIKHLAFQVQGGDYLEYVMSCQECGGAGCDACGGSGDVECAFLLADLPKEAREALRACGELVAAEIRNRLDP